MTCNGTLRGLMRHPARWLTPVRVAKGVEGGMVVVRRRCEGGKEAVRGSEEAVRAVRGRHGGGMRVVREW